VRKILSLFIQGYTFYLLRKSEDRAFNYLNKIDHKFYTPKIYEIYGNLLIRRGDLDLGENILKEGIEKYKKSKGIYRVLSQIFLRKGEVDKAIEIIKLAKENNKETYWYNLVLGDLFYYEKKDLDNALKEFIEYYHKYF